MQTQNEPSNQRIVDPLDDGDIAANPGVLDDTDITVKTEETSPQLEKEAAPAESVPAKFQGKTVEEIVEAYNNLESKFGKQGNDLGELRKLTDKYVLQNLAEQNARSSKETEVEQVSITDDDYLINPKETIEKLVQQQVEPLAKQLESKNREQAIQELEAKHPDMADIVQDEKFQEWVLSSPGREANWGKAANGDFIQADELFSTYKALHPTKEVAKEVIDNNPGLGKTELETATAMSAGSSSDAVDSVAKAPIFSRRRLVALQVENPNKYRELGPEITKAYQEGRVVD